MSERNEVQGTRNAAAEKTNVVFRRRLTCDSRLSAAAEAIVAVYSEVASTAQRSNSPA